MLDTFLGAIRMCLLFVPLTNPTPTGLDQCQWKLIEFTPYVSVPCEAGPFFGMCGIQLGRKSEEPAPTPPE